MTEIWKDYTSDLSKQLVEYAQEAKQELDRVKGTDDELFRTGYLCAFHRVISLMKQQAEGFQIPLSELGLDAIDPENGLSGN